jgi:hypothetical protein
MALGGELCNAEESEHFQPRSMWLARHCFSRRFIHQTRVLAAGEGLMVEIELNEIQGFLADGFSFIQIRAHTAVEIFHHGAATMRFLQKTEHRIFYRHCQLAER